jgi:predicted hotdog family 3-hydroxylacyl-ACP dehydratase
MTLDRAAIAGSLPHAGDMCLLDAVQQWDATDITCVAAAPSAAHPLARGGVVPAVAAAEYAAQATAMHGALLGGHRTPAGMLAKLSNVELHAKCIPAGGGLLAVHARLLGRNASGCLYDFEVDCANHPILSGRLMVAFTAHPA